MTAADTEAYRGVLGAFPYAWRVAESWGFRVYVVVAALVTVAVTIIVAGGVFQLLAATGRSGGTAAFARAFYILVGVAVIGPLLAPVLVLARRHRRDTPTTRHDQRVLAATGFVFVASMYLGLVASTPPANQQPIEGMFEPLVEALYGLPRISGVVFPVVGAVIVYVGVRWTAES